MKQHADTLHPSSRWSVPLQRRADTLAQACSHLVVPGKMLSVIDLDGRPDMRGRLDQIWTRIGASAVIG